MIALQNTKKRKRRLRKRRKPSLRFTPTAWAKLLFLRDAGHTEVGGFGISDPNDLLLVTDFALVRQTTSPITVEFDDVSVADHFDRYIDKGYTPEQVGRIWIHTHPGQSARPSGVDEDTFARCFGDTDWSVMFILACGGATYGRLRHNVGPGSDVRLKCSVDFVHEFPESDHQSWFDEYEQNVNTVDPFVPLHRFDQEAPSQLFDDTVLASEWIAS